MSDGWIEAIVARLHSLYPRLIDLSLGRLRELLAKLGSPERHLPPVIHVAGTNGKGSACAFLRAMGEAAGWRVHVYTSPHLVQFNERIRIAGRLVSDDELAAMLERIEQVNSGAPITVFEVITAAALYAFAQHPAELCVLEVGLGGRGDATNVIERPAACAITSISLDHREMLGDTIVTIAGEKAGIIKPGVPVAIGAQTPDARMVLLSTAERVGAPVWLRGREWDIDGLRYSDGQSEIMLEPLSLPGPHQHDNAGIAVAALRASGLPIPSEAIAHGAAMVVWPARLQQLHGALARMLTMRMELWLDGGHNPGAGEALAAHLQSWTDRPVHLVVGMKKSKDARLFLQPLLPYATSVWAVAEPGQYLALPVTDIVAASGGIAHPGPRVADALATVARSAQPGRVLICGSLYLAGEVLKLDGLEPVA
jgi:dihydrofolate synthase / folylpolyglutamate synthase